MDELKEKVAQCCRLLCMMDLIATNGHVSARIPGTDRILIHPRDVGRLEVEPRHIVTVDLNGKVIEGSEEPPSETPLHTCIYLAREDVLSVVHLHSHYSTLFSIVERKLLPVSSQGAIFAAKGVPVYPRSGTITTEEQGKEVAKVLGGARAVLLKGHGSVVVAGGVEAAFFASLALEENARYQFEATLLGEPQVLDEIDIERVLEMYEPERYARKIWIYHLSLARSKGIL